MPLSLTVQKLQNRWQKGNGWPKRLKWLQIEGLRGWVGQQFECKFPIMAIVGENGCGKSTILHCAASVYQQEDPRDCAFADVFAS